MVLLVLLSIPLEQRLEGSEEPPEGICIQGGDHHLCLGSDRCLSLILAEQSQLPEIIIFPILENDIILVQRPLDSLGPSLHDEVEPLPLLTLLNDKSPYLESLLLKAVPDLFLLVLVESCKQLDLIKEVIVLLSICHCVSLDNGRKGLPV